MKFVVFIVFIFGSACAFFTNCPNFNVPGPDRMESPNCSGDRCRAQRGGILNARIWATPLGAHTELVPRVTAFIAGVPVNIPMEYPYTNACYYINFGNGTRTQCPTVPRVQYLLYMEMPIPRTIPSFQNTRVRVEFFDRGQRAACGQVMADII